MLKLLRTLINNGFVVLALLVAVTLYLAYGQKQAAHQHEAVAAPADTTPAPPAPDVEQAAEAPEESPTPAQTAEAVSPQPSAESSPPPDTASDDETADTPPVQTAPSPAKPAVTASTAGTIKAPEKAAESDTTQSPALKTPPAEAVPSSTDGETTASSAGTQPAKKTAKTVPGLLFDPVKLDHRAILSRFDSPQQALREARSATRAGDYQWAAAIYFSLLKIHPDADIAGTLGNVLWRLGDKRWAHRAWRYAAQLLIREGRIDTARAFARNIRAVDAPLADEIEAHLPPKNNKQD